MNKRGICLAVSVAGLLILCWWLSLVARRELPAQSSGLPASSLPAESPLSAVATQLPQAVVPSGNVSAPSRLGPRGQGLLKITNYPPQTAEEKDQWEWWNAMCKADPDFEWKMPIEFYGKVVDQFGLPVAGAEVVFNWTTVGSVPDPRKTILTASDGRFAVTGIQGNGITITAYAEGYVRTRDSHQSFGYAAFYRDDFHIPDSNSPVIFRLRKLVDAEPLCVFSPYGVIVVGGQPLNLDVETGRVASRGDLAFSVSLGAISNRYGSEFAVTVLGLDGAGLVLSDEEFLSEAPKSGYQNKATVTHRVNVPNYRPEQLFSFYVRTGKGKYASVGVRISLWRDMSKADFGAGVYLNPSGSRKLEFDQSKWINR